MEESHIWIISTSGDKLSAQTSEKLKERNIPVLISSPSNIANHDIALIEQKIFIDHKLIGGILFRAKPDSFYSESFIDEDRQFCDSEIGAVLLAAMNLPSILSINKYDALTWFDKSLWSGWRHRCRQNNIKVAPFIFGNADLNGSYAWLPYNSLLFRIKPHQEIRKLLGTAITKSIPNNTYYLIGEKVFASNNTFSFEPEIKMLNENGIYICELTTDMNGNLITINTLPYIDDDIILDEISNLLVKKYEEFMSVGRH